MPPGRSRTFPGSLSRPFVPPRPAVGAGASEGADNAEHSQDIVVVPGAGRVVVAENAAVVEAEAAGAPEEVRGPTGWMPQRDWATTKVATLDAARRRPAPRSYQEPDGRGNVMHRHDKVVQGRIEGRNCTLEALNFAAGKYQTVTRTQLAATSLLVATRPPTDVSLLHICKFANLPDIQKAFPFTLETLPGMSWSQLVLRTEGIVVARCEAQRDDGGDNDFHCISYDAWRGILFLGGDLATVLTVEDDRKDPAAFEREFVDTYGFEKQLEFVYLLKVSSRYAHRFNYNTPNDYKPRPSNKRRRGNCG